MNDRPADPQQLLKSAVGKSAAARVPSGSVVVLGTGSTAAYAIEHLGQRLRDGTLTDVRGVATSFDAANLARRHGIPLTTLDDTPRIHVAIDGADEVDPDLALVKGGGAAHTQEKVIDAHADLFIVIVDDQKLVQRLGTTFAVPVEVLPMAVAPVTRSIEQRGGRPQLRMGAKKIGPLITDQGNMLLDVTFDGIDDPAHLERTLNNIPGTVENGLFVGLADLVLVGELVDGRPRVRELPRPTSDLSCKFA